MSLSADLKILWHLARPNRGQTHAARLEAFYQHQAGDYDRFRKKLLPGRDELFRAVGRLACEQFQTRPTWLDFGGGTGANIECIEQMLPSIGDVHIVDLSESLLRVADRRIADRGWRNVFTHHADVTQFSLPSVLADVITFSYSLTMIPNWLAAIDRAAALLAPGGLIGIVDFYVSHKHSTSNARSHNWWTRTFWPTWFAFDNVFIGPDRLAALQHRFETIDLQESTTKVPYMPLGRVPYFRWIGRKR